MLPFWYVLCACSGSGSGRHCWVEHPASWHAGSLILQVPERALITNRAAHANETFAAAVACAGTRLTPLQVDRISCQVSFLIGIPLKSLPTDANHDQNSLCMQTLAAFLLYECAKGSDSQWAPYLRQLPASFTTFFTWTAREIAALQVCCVRRCAPLASCLVVDMNDIGKISRGCSFGCRQNMLSRKLQRAAGHCMTNGRRLCRSSGPSVSWPDERSARLCARQHSHCLHATSAYGRQCCA